MMTTNVKTQGSPDWKSNAEGPRNTVEKIAGIWRLDFNHALTQDIISGTISTDDLVNIVADVIDAVADLAEKLGSILDLISVILKLGKDLLINADKGNGITIKFNVWVVPTEVLSSTYTWN